MKKYLLGLFALVLAIGFSAFTAKKANFTDRFVVYVSGDKTDVDSYSQQATEPTLSCTGNSQICWFKADDSDASGSVSQEEFTISFNALDVTAGQGLDNETEQAHILQKKS